MIPPAVLEQVYHSIRQATRASDEQRIREAQAEFERLRKELNVYIGLRNSFDDPALFQRGVRARQERLIRALSRLTDARRDLDEEDAATAYVIDRQRRGEA